MSFLKVLLVKCVNNFDIPKAELEEHGHKLFKTWKNAKSHHACLATCKVQTTGSIIIEFQAISQSERQKNRRAF